MTYAMLLLVNDWLHIASLSLYHKFPEIFEHSRGVEGVAVEPRHKDMNSTPESPPISHIEFHLQKSITFRFFKKG